MENGTSRRWARGALLVSTVVLVVAGATVALADNTISDGDGLAPVADSNLNLGEVCAGEASSDTVLVAVTRQGSYSPGTQVFKNGSVVTVSVSTSGAGLSAVMGAPNTISIPATWSTAANGTQAGTVGATVTLTTASLGAFSGSVTFRGSGVNPSDGAINRDDTMTVTATVVTCAPTDTTPPVISYTVNGLYPEIPDGDNGWFVSDVTLDWTVSDPESAFTTDGCVDTSITSDQLATDYSCSATSEGGTAGPVTVTIKRDATAPTITGGLDPATPDGDSGWYVTGPTASFTCSDGTSGVASCGPDTTFGEGENQSSTGWAYDNAGNSASATVSDVDVDLTDPSVSVALDPTTPDGSNGWYVTAPTAEFTCTDGTSGVYSCPDDYTFGEGADQSHTGTGYDIAGRSSSATVSNVDVDLTDPSISVALDRAAAASGWFNEVTGAPKAQFTCSDATSGVVACPADYTFGEGENLSHTGTVFDHAGNSASATVSDVDVDLTDPTTAVTGVTSGATYLLGFVPAAGCSGSDALSGIASHGTLTVTGGTVNGVGSFTATCADAVDIAGNIGGFASVTYTVQYAGVSGILQPINPDNTSVFKRGQAIPVKFRLAGDEFSGFSTSGWAIQRLSASCAGFDPETATAETVPSNTPSTVFRYDPSADQYVFNADMKNQPVGSCWMFRVTLDSGQQLLSAMFKLAK